MDTPSQSIVPTASLLPLVTSLPDPRARHQSPPLSQRSARSFMISLTPSSRRFSSRACSNISRALPRLLRYCSRVTPQAEALRLSKTKSGCQRSMMRREWRKGEADGSWIPKIVADLCIALAVPGRYHSARDPSPTGHTDFRMTAGRCCSAVDFQFFPRKRYDKGRIKLARAKFGSARNTLIRNGRKDSLHDKHFRRAIQKPLRCGLCRWRD